jgi:Ca2+/Na+ antiporter
MMDHVCDVYLSAAIAKIAKKMKLSQALAGATLLALANGATDIITVFVAAGNDQKEGDDLAIGDLFGSSIYSFTVVLAYIIYQTRGGVISKVSFKASKNSIG